MENNIAESISIKCSEEHCDYTTTRPDNLKRHVENVHQQKREICECGTSLCSTSLKRHKKNHCPQNKKSIGDTKKSMDRNRAKFSNAKVEKVIIDRKYQRSVCFPVVNTEKKTSMNNNGMLKSHKKLTIEVTVEQLEDGHISIAHSPIKVGEFDLTLVPTENLQTLLKQTGI